MDALISFGTWFFDNLITIGISFFVLWKGKIAWNIFIIQPLQGPDKTTSNTELARFALVIFLGYMVYQEGQAEGSLYPVEVFYALIIGVILVGGFEKAAMALISKK
jgi:hypothetical protein